MHFLPISWRISLLLFFWTTASFSYPSLLFPETQPGTNFLMSRATFIDCTAEQYAAIRQALPMLRMMTHLGTYSTVGPAMDHEINRLAFRTSFSSTARDDYEYIHARFRALETETALTHDRDNPFATSHEIPSVMEAQIQCTDSERNCLQWTYATIRGGYVKINNGRIIILVSSTHTLVQKDRFITTIGPMPSTVRKLFQLPCLPPLHGC